MAPALPSVPASAVGRECEGHRRRDLCAAPALAPGPAILPSSKCHSFPPTPAGTERKWAPQEGGSRARSVIPPLTPRCVGGGHARFSLWAARNAWSDAATPQALWNPRAHGRDNALDLHREVTAAGRPEDISETWRQAPGHIQPDVTLLCLWLPPFAFLGLKAAEAATKLRRSPWWASLGDLR